MKKAVVMLTIVILLAASLATPAAASSTCFNYNYDSWGTAVPSQAGYDTETVYFAHQLDASLGNFNTPQDLFVSKDNRIYVLDSGNVRVVCLNSDLSLNHVINKFTYKGNAVTLKNPTGIFVAENDFIYIADPENHRVVICDQTGTVIRVLERPKTNLLSENLEFLPQKVLVDSAGMIYVSVSGVYQGALLYNQKGVFTGFYGSNEVQITAALLLDMFWKKILSDDQVNNIARYVPEEITSFDIDGRDFVYTVTQSESVTQKLKKLNPMGTNILKKSEFGEMEKQYIAGKLTTSRFTDVAVDDHGRMNVVDRQNNRIFQYDKEGSLLFIMGGAGSQAGTYQNPAAIESIGDKLLVLDSARGSITVLAPTAFGDLVHEAVDIYNDGQYSKATELWQKVLRADQNYELAYISIGKSFFADGKYKEAAEYFRLGNDREDNSSAFQAYRNIVIQKHFPLVCLVAVLLIGILIWLYNRPSRIDRTESAKRKMNPFRMLFHPIDTSLEIKQKNSGSFLYSAVILGLWYLATIFKYSLTNFRFNLNNVDRTNIILLFLSSIPVFAVWVVSNWGVCTLMDGKGHLKEIWITNTYCLIPWVGSIFLYVLLSQVLVNSEIMFLNAVIWIGAGWSIFLILCALSSIHDYFSGRTIISVLLSLLGMLIVVFLILLVCSLVKQAYDFVYSIINEILYRFR